MMDHSAPTLSQEWLHNTELEHDAHENSGRTSDDVTQEGSGGNDSTVVRLILAGAALTGAMFLKNALDSEKRKDTLLRLKPLSLLRGKGDKGGCARVAFLNPVSAEVVLAARAAFASVRSLADASIDVIPTKVQLYASCDVERGSVVSAKAAAQEQAMEGSQLLGVPCIVHAQCMLVNGAEPELLMSPAALVERARSKRGGAALTIDVVNICAWSVDGRVAEVASSSATGVIDASSTSAPIALSSTLLSIAASCMRLTEASAESLVGVANAQRYKEAAQSSPLRRCVVAPCALFVEAAIRMEMKSLLHDSLSQQRSRRSLASYLLPMKALTWLGMRAQRSSSVGVASTAEQPQVQRWSVHVADTNKDPRVEYFGSFADAVVALLEAVRWSSIVAGEGSHSIPSSVTLADGPTALCVWAE